MNERELHQNIDYESVYDPQINVEQYLKKLEDLLRRSRVNIIQRRIIMRQKAQEFRERTRKRDIRER